MYLDLPQAHRVQFFADPQKRMALKAAGDNQVPIKLAWAWDGPVGTQFTVTVFPADDSSNKVVVKTRQTFVEVTNLLIGQRYHWQVRASVDGQVIESKTATFATEDQAPRLMRIEGVPNVRDLGGWKTLSGKRVRQGVAYRSAGLNDNARVATYTAEALHAAAQTDQALREAYEQRAPRDRELEQAMARQRQVLADMQRIRIAPYRLKAAWTVFQPDPQVYSQAALMRASENLGEVPDILMGASGKQAILSEQGVFSFNEFQEYAVAVFMQVFDSPESGYMQLSCGADWYWDLRINGELAYDKTSGNVAVASSDNYVLHVPVRRGRNLIVATVLSGAQGWSWCCAQTRAASVGHMAQSMLEELDIARSKLWDVPCGYQEAGKTRLSEHTRSYLTRTLGIRTDLDLRTPGECWGMERSPLGDDATWFRCPSQAYARMQTDEGKEAFADVFKVFLNAENYPLVFHCIGGQDRTGAVAFLINGLLGVGVDDLYRDWELSGLCNANMRCNHREMFDLLIEGFETLPGDTMHEKIEHYVLSLGFTRKDIQKLRSLLLEP